MVVERIYCGVQNYAWGKPGSSSKVAQLAAHAEKDFRFVSIALKNCKKKVKKTVKKRIVIM